jgi:hypothetical protein
MRGRERTDRPVSLLSVMHFDTRCPVLEPDSGFGAYGVSVPI